MPEAGKGGMEAGALLEALLELASRAELEVRVLSAGASAQEFTPTRSAACRVGSRIWVVLAPDDPPLVQAGILAGALARYRAEFLEENFVSPGVRTFLENADPESASR